MNKFIINSKTKPAIVILTIVFICLIAVLAYLNINNPETLSDAVNAESTMKQTTVIIEPQEPIITIPERAQAATQSDAQEETKTVAAEALQEATTNTTASESAVIANSIQGEQPKVDVTPTPPPAPKTNDDATDKIKKPTYNEQDTAPQESQPQMGERDNKGQVYIEGFGWVRDEGGGGEGSSVGNEGDQLTGNKVGSMD